MSQLRVNDICIGQNFVRSTERNGMECVIVGPLAMRTARDAITGQVTTALRYAVRWADEIVWYQEPHYLRRKSPPASTADMREYEALMDRLMNRKEQTV